MTPRRPRKDSKPQRKKSNTRKKNDILSRARNIRDKFPKKDRKPLKERPIANILPNMATVLALCSGLTSVRMAMLDQYDYALLAILVAAFMDAMDGRIARYLDKTSRFGAELDSFSDLICFGVSPALVMYLKSVKDLGGIGWVLVLFCAVCMALRLARFNVHDIEGTTPSWAKGFFIGVPAPAAAFLMMMPLYLHMQFKNNIFINPYFCGFMMVCAGGFMVSNFPTFSFKTIKVKQTHILPVMLFFVILAGLLLTEPYLVLSLIAVCYLASFPFSYKKYETLKIKNTES